MGIANGFCMFGLVCIPGRGIWGGIGGSGGAGWEEGDLISSVACLLTAGVGV